MVLEKSCIHTLLSFSVRTLFLLVAFTATCLVWFDDDGIGITMIDGIAVQNDARFWPGFERLRSPKEYRDWCDRIPVRPPLPTGREVPLPSFVDFKVQDLLVVALPKTKDMSGLYSPKVRLRGHLVFMGNCAAESGQDAQEIGIPKNSKVVFGHNWTAVTYDAVVAGFAILVLLASYAFDVRKAVS